MGLVPGGEGPVVGLVPGREGPVVGLVPGEAQVPVKRVALEGADGAGDVVAPGGAGSVKVLHPRVGLARPVVRLPGADPGRKGPLVAQSGKLAVGVVSKGPGVGVQLVREGVAEGLDAVLPSVDEAVGVEVSTEGPVVLGSVVGGGPVGLPVGFVLGNAGKHLLDVGVKPVDGALDVSGIVVVGESAAVLGVGSLGVGDQLVNDGTGLLGAGLDAGPDLSVELLPLSGERSQVELGVRGTGEERGVGGCNM